MGQADTQSSLAEQCAHPNRAIRRNGRSSSCDDPPTARSIWLSASGGAIGPGRAPQVDARHCRESQRGIHIRRSSATHRREGAIHRQRSWRHRRARYDGHEPVHDHAWDALPHLRRTETEHHANTFVIDARREDSARWSPAGWRPRSAWCRGNKALTDLLDQALFAPSESLRRMCDRKPTWARHDADRQHSARKLCQSQDLMTADSARLLSGRGLRAECAALAPAARRGSRPSLRFLAPSVSAAAM
jgi:hypothetical protein